MQSVRPARPSVRFRHGAARVSTRLVLLVALLLAWPARGQAQDRFGISVFGVAAHYGPQYYFDDNGVIRRYEWFEPGVTFEYVAHETTHQRFALVAGGYRDSELRRNLLAGVAWRWRLTSALDVGVAAVVWTSPSYPIPFGLLPLVSYRLHHIGINGIILPWSGYGAFGSFATIYF